MRRLYQLVVGVCVFTVVAPCAWASPYDRAPAPSVMGATRHRSGPTPGADPTLVSGNPNLLQIPAARAPMAQEQHPRDTTQPVAAALPSTYSPMEAQRELHSRDRPQSVQDLALFLAGMALALTASLIVSRRSRAQATRRSEQEVRKLRAIFDTSPDAMWVSDRTGRLIEHNARLAEVAPRAPIDLHGRPIGGLFGTRDTAHVQAAHDLLLATGTPRRLTLTVRGNRSTPVHLEVSKVPLRNTDGWIYGILSVARDMSHRVANEERLRLWALAFEHAGFGIVLSDSPRRRILAANPKFADERGHAPEAPTGMHADGLYPADPRPTHEAAREAHMGGGTFVAMPQQAVTAEQCLVQLVGESTGRLREVLQDPFRPDLAAPVAITASAGWTSIDPERGSPDSAYKEAELAMYRAKANGRDRACYFEPATQHAPEHAERLLRKL